MGLDMYLNKRVYVGAYYEFNGVTGSIDLRNKQGEIKVNVRNVSEIVERVAYWRKANMIHGWFISNCADGEDDCQPVYVPAEKLIELRKLCKSIIEMPEGPKRDAKAMGLLPPCEGFFFGSTKIDADYYENLQYTVDVLSDISLDDIHDYEYLASW